MSSLSPVSVYFWEMSCSDGITPISSVFSSCLIHVEWATQKPKCLGFFEDFFLPFEVVGLVSVSWSRCSSISAACLSTLLMIVDASMKISLMSVAEHNTTIQWDLELAAQASIGHSMAVFDSLS